MLLFLFLFWFCQIYCSELKLCVFPNYLKNIQEWLPVINTYLFAWNPVCACKSMGKNPCKLYTKGWQISYQLMQDWRESGADIHFIQEKVEVSRWQLYKHVCFFKSDFFIYILTCKFIRMANQVLMSFWEVMKLIGDSGKPSYLLKENCH